MAGAIFTGNVVDENGTSIDCKFQAYHYQQNAWSGVRDTEFQQFSIDLVDSDWLTNVNSATNNNEDVLICFWVDGSDRSGLHSRFSMIRINLNGSNVYTPDIELRPKEAPTCTWYLQSTGKINNIISSSHTSTDNYQWTYSGNTFYHYRTYFGQTIFDSVGNLVHEYDWNDSGSGFVTDNTHNYSSIGDYVVTHRTTNQYNLSSDCAQSIRIKYNPPYGNISYNDNAPYYLDTLTVTSNVTDLDSRITNIIYYFDNTEVEQNTTPNHSYNQLLDTVKSYPVRTELYWNDGYESQQVNINSTVNLSNTPPTVNLSTNKVENTYTFISGATDFENRLQRVDFRIYVSPEYIFEETPSAYTWTLLDTRSIYANPWSTSATFYKGGHFKLTATAYDQDGGISTLGEYEFDVVVTTQQVVVSGQSQYFDWE